MFVWFAIEGRSREDVGGLCSLSKKRGITREVYMGVDIDEQTTGHDAGGGTKKHPDRDRLRKIPVN